MCCSLIHLANPLGVESEASRLVGAPSLLAESESTAEQNKGEARWTFLSARAGSRLRVKKSQTRRVWAVLTDQGLHNEHLKVQSAQGSIGLATTQ